jgi:orotate phosphoribosyltransferase
VQFVKQDFGIEVVSIATLADLLQYLATNEDPQLQRCAAPVQAYRQRYGC